MEGKVFALQTHSYMRELLDKHYKKARHAKETGQKVFWSIGQAATDIMVAMDMIPIYPENHCAMCGARGVSTEHCEIAEAHDYSPDICSYARNDLGCILSGGGKSPVGGLPAPDILYIATLCNTHVKWFEELSRIYNVPLMNLDTPFIHEGLSKDDVDSFIKYIYEQLVEMTEFLADFCGRPYNWDGLQQAVANSSKAAQLFSEIVTSAKHRPSPITAFDTFLHLGPLMDFRGFPEAVDYYQKLKAEVEERKSQDFSAIGGERFRLFWDNIPIWFRVGHLARKFAGYGANCVVGTYPFVWMDAFAHLDPERPLETIAEAQALLLLNRSTAYRMKFLERLVDEYALDGLVMQMSRTCKPYIVDQYAIQKEVERRTGLPAVIIEGDMVDTRLYSDADVDGAIEAFISVLEDRARQKV